MSKLRYDSLNDADEGLDSLLTEQFIERSASVRCKVRYQIIFSLGQWREEKINIEHIDVGGKIIYFVICLLLFF